MSATSPTTHIYPSPHGFEGILTASPQSPPQILPEPLQVQTSQPRQQNDLRSPNAPTDGKARLRKACDSCSIRKVKCDETGPPCRSCAALDIPCTFARPSRRRGPPNRHAEAIKRQKLDTCGPPGSSAPTSPTQAGAQALASLSTHQPLSAKSICSLPTLQLLIDDFFTYIHPLVPIPHEPTFRASFARREDLTNRSFLALLASMIGTLVASFPRKVLVHFRTERRQRMYPSSMSLVERCHKITTDARGSGYLDKELTVYNAATSYFIGLTSAYCFDMRRCRIYFAECTMILRILDLHKGPRRNSADAPRSTFSNHFTSGSSREPTADGLKEVDFVNQELSRRLFYTCYVGFASMQQLGSKDGEILMPPSTPHEPYPPLPLEIDDAYIFPTHIVPQPPGVVSELTGFNANVRVFRSYNSLTALEMAFGIDEIFDWERQKRMIAQCLRNVKSALDGVPPELVLNHVRPFSTGDQMQSGPSFHRPAEIHGSINGRQNTADFRFSSRRHVQCEIQKANIYASQLGTRSYLVEKYWNLCEAHNRVRSNHSGSISNNSSPGVVAAGLEGQLKQPAAVGPRSPFDTSEEAMAGEREGIVKDLLVLLRTISQVNMEPNGASFTHKIRQIASTLLSVPRTRMGRLAQKVELYLAAFLDVLMTLERLSPGASVGGENPNGHGNGNGSVGERGLNNGGAGMMTDWEVKEEEELRAWASLKEFQQKFAEAGGFLVEL